MRDARARAKCADLIGKRGTTLANKSSDARVFHP